jgi:energy-coupling factor transporter ATP-binding protein EcfA2
MSTLCWKCDGTDHSTEFCDLPFAVERAADFVPPNARFHANAPLPRNCAPPKKQAASSSSSSAATATCYTCQLRGHFAKDCPEGDKALTAASTFFKKQGEVLNEYDANAFCSRCRRMGHRGIKCRVPVSQRPEPREGDEAEARAAAKVGAAVVAAALLEAGVGVGAVEEEKEVVRKLPASTVKVADAVVDADVADTELSTEQKRVITAIKQGKSVFFTGAAGSGKTRTSKEVARIARDVRKRMYKTATTGVAAVAIGGMTIHSFAAISNSDETADKIFDRSKKNRQARERWQNCDILWIDEISMLSKKLFGVLERLARHARGNINPFGGVQLLMCGDFSQLPPVSKNDAVDYADASAFAFQSNKWDTCVDTSIFLRKIWRQSDRDFVKILAEVRHNKCSPKSLRLLRGRVGVKLKNADGIVPTKLYPRNVDVDRENSEALAKLPGASRGFVATDEGEEPYLETAKRNWLAPEKLELKGGAQVMLLKNIDVPGGLANGSRGVVVGFREARDEDVDDLVRAVGFMAEFGSSKVFRKQMLAKLAGSSFPVVKFVNGRTRLISRETFTVEVGGVCVAARTQIPLKCAWALSVHKSQGATLDFVEAALANAKQPGQVYTALSRVRGLECLSLIDFDEKAINCDMEVERFYRKLALLGEHDGNGEWDEDDDDAKAEDDEEKEEAPAPAPAATSTSSSSLRNANGKRERTGTAPLPTVAEEEDGDEEEEEDAPAATSSRDANGKHERTDVVSLPMVEEEDEEDEDEEEDTAEVPIKAAAQVDEEDEEEEEEEVPVKAVAQVDDDDEEEEDEEEEVVTVMEVDGEEDEEEDEEVPPPAKRAKL